MNTSDKALRRYWKFVEKTDGCWLWTGRDFVGNGYARFYWGCKPIVRVYVHRFAYFLAYGELDDGLVIHHTCGNKLCVNPDHLQAMTQAEHMLEHDLHRLGNEAQDRLREAEGALTYYAEGNTDASGKLAKRHLERWNDGNDQ